VKPWIAILGGGLTAGALDIVAPCLIHQVGPLQVFRAVATGVLGKAAREGGLPAAALGAFCHFAISVVAAAVFFAISRKMPLLVRQPLLGGVAMGVGMYVVMNYVVVPLSNSPGKPPAGLTMIALNLAAMIVFGLAIALFAGRSPLPTSPAHAPGALTA
jgi:hypothetical protein